ncbi:hypothetical protein CEXT_715361 [Caerostris extrusa]|uniref:Uncharacterized protein n=1 Tax=Caerostris extrusa TaxID=172846 RepID=A0AAV4QAD3_CAEEX|nr:hypothetical protein CEXT_715361 [Caerostris extrusa]
MSSVVKSVCNCGPTISLPFQGNTRFSRSIEYHAKFVITFLWVMWKVKIGIGWNIPHFLELFPCDQVSKSHRGIYGIQWERWILSKPTFNLM